MTDIKELPFDALQQIAKAACADAREHGLWGHLQDLSPLFKRVTCADLIRDEAEEALDAVSVPGDYTEELADVLIMTLSAAAYLDINIGAAVKKKMLKNKRRPYKHGKEKP